MKKTLLILVALLMVAGLAHAGAAPAPAHTNAVSVSGNGSPGTPVQEYILVRYPHRGDDPQINIAAAITSGDVLVWNTTSADGVSISVDIQGYGFAGVAVTEILTPDTNKVDLTEDNWGYMCIRGYCLAKVDTSNSTTGFEVVPSGNIDGAATGSFGTKNYFDAGNSGGAGINSADVGVLLRDDAADGVMPVWLR